MDFLDRASSACCLRSPVGLIGAFLLYLSHAMLEHGSPDGVDHKGIMHFYGITFQSCCRLGAEEIMHAFCVAAFFFSTAE